MSNAVEDAKQEAASLRAELARVQEAHKTTANELQTAAESCRSLEHKLQEKTAELTTLAQEKNTLKSELEEVIVRYQEATHEQHKLQYDKANAEELLGNIQSSKQVLQRAMNEQMLGLNMQLNEAREECLKHTLTIKKLSEAHANLQELYQTEQRKNQTLLSTLHTNKQPYKLK